MGKRFENLEERPALMRPSMTCKCSRSDNEWILALQIRSRASQDSFEDSKVVCTIQLVGFKTHFSDFFEYTCQEKSHLSNKCHDTDIPGRAGSLNFAKFET